MGGLIKYASILLIPFLNHPSNGSDSRLGWGLCLLFCPRDKSLVYFTSCCSLIYVKKQISDFNSACFQPIGNVSLLSMRRYFFLLISIVALLVLTLPSIISGDFAFVFDMGRDQLWTRNMVELRRPTLIGPWGSIRSILWAFMVLSLINSLFDF